jgi:hypothetical protein
MDVPRILESMREYFVERKPAEVAEDFGRQPVVSLLKDSLDVVDFFIHLEDKLGMDTGADLTKLGPRLIKSNFTELAGEVAKHLKRLDSPSN